MRLIMPKLPGISGVNRKELAWIAIILLSFYVFVPQLKSFHESWHLLSHPDYSYVIISSIFIFATFVAAATTYCFLATKSLPLVEEFIVQVAAMFVNRLLPAGIGGIGANFAYLKNKKIKSSEAASMVAMNNIMGVMSHLLVLLFTVTVFSSGSVLPAFGLKHGIKHIIGIGTIVIIIAIVLALALKFQGIKKIAHDFLRQVASYRFHPYRTALAMVSQLALSICNILALTFSAKAVGVNLSFADILLVYSLGSLISHFIPTPGGLGGFEAGLAAGFVAYGIDTSGALASVLLYRIISYWAPLVIGAVTLVYVQRRGWFLNE